MIDPSDRAQRPDRLAARSPAWGSARGCLLFAGTLAAHGDAPWPGLVGGFLAAGLSQRASLAGDRPRAGSPRRPRGARGADVYLDAASLVLAALVALLHPLGYVALALCAWLLARRPAPRRAQVRRPAHPRTVSGRCRRLAASSVARVRAHFAPCVLARLGLRTAHERTSRRVIDDPTQARPLRDRRDGARDARARGCGGRRAGAGGADAPRPLRSRLRRRVPLGDPGVRRVDRHRRRSGAPPDSRDELVPPRGGPLRGVRLLVSRLAALRDRAPADGHGLQHEPRPPRARAADGVRGARRRWGAHRRHHLPDLPRPLPPRAPARLRAHAASPPPRCCATP